MTDGSCQSFFNSLPILPSQNANDLALFNAACLCEENEAFEMVELDDHHRILV